MEANDLPDAGPSEAKQVLLRALDNITQIEEETGGQVGYLIVCHATTFKDGEEPSRCVRGWDATDHPHFVLTGLLDEICFRLRAEGGAFDPLYESDDDDESGDD